MSFKKIAATLIFVVSGSIFHAQGAIVYSGETNSHYAACKKHADYRYPKEGVTLSTGEVDLERGLAWCKLEFTGEIWIGPPYNRPPNDVDFTVGVSQGPKCPYGQFYDSKLGCIYPSEGWGEPNTGNPHCEGAGNPIGFLRGNKYQSEIDFTWRSSDLPLEIKRDYNSAYPFNGMFGKHWISAYDLRLSIEEVSEDLITVTRVDGKLERFHFDARSESWGPVDFLQNSLLHDVDGGWTYRSEDNKNYKFFPDGKVDSVSP